MSMERVEAERAHAMYRISQRLRIPREEYWNILKMAMGRNRKQEPANGRNRWKTSFKFMGHWITVVWDAGVQELVTVYPSRTAPTQEDR